MEKKRMIINLGSSIFSFIVNICISFLLTPFIVEKLGNESYGFIGLANNFVSYASIITVALNSVAGRFITINIHQDKKKEAQIYFNSVLMANIIISVLLAIVGIFIVLRLEYMINISQYLIVDVKITFALVFLNFIINIIGSIFTVATFVRNRLDISSTVSIFSNVLRVVILVSLFYSLKPRLFYISIAAIVMTVFACICNMKISKKLLPDIAIKFKQFNVKAIKEMVSLGMWNSINNLSQILLTGLDLLIANIFISGNAMGILSLAKTIPNVIVSFLCMIGGVYAPKFTILYAKNKIDSLVHEINLSIKVLGLISSVPLAGFIIFGKEFYSLWLPSAPQEEILQIQILSVLTLGPAFISAFVFSLFNINTITNRLKVPVMVTLTLSIISTVVVVIFLKFTNAGVYAIAGVSSFCLLMRAIFFVPSYAAHTLNIKVTTFYPPMIKGVISFIFISGIFFIINKFINISTWGDFIRVVCSCGILGYIINFFMILKKSEREALVALVKSKFKLRKVIG